MRMTISWQKSFKSGFSFVCIILWGMMMGYWIYKYDVEDRDIGVVDVIDLSEANQIEMPVLSLCFEFPFTEEKLKQFGTTDRVGYWLYLKGEIFEDQFEHVDYQNVSLNLGDYFLYLKEIWHNSSSWVNSSLTTTHEETFNGFFDERILKCFTLKNDIGANRHIRGFKFLYDLDKLLNDDSHSGALGINIFYKIHYPGQFFLGETPIMYTLTHETYFYVVIIKELEILERRNSRNKKCSKESTSYDKMILEKYLSSTGCKVPYISYDTSLPRCNMTSNTTDFKLDYNAPDTLHIPKACKRMSKVIHIIGQPSFDDLFPKVEDVLPFKVWRFSFFYPKELKVITQSKEVDLHSLIGNIGGYLGLFLGKIIQYKLIFQDKMYFPTFGIVQFISSHFYFCFRLRNHTNTRFRVCNLRICQEGVYMII